ncbi:MAG: carbon-nitrogen hydrolase family protein [Planctomycetota bacterium]
MAKAGIMKVALCQFAVSADIAHNGAMVCRQIDRAKRLGANVVHFPECALSGYAGTDHQTWDEYDWEELKAQTVSVIRTAVKRKIWVVVGSAHPLSGKRLPHNSLYVIDPQGRIVDRYDKRFCTEGDLKFYTSGDHFAVFEINGVKCGLLICYDVRFPELYRQYKRRDVQVIFHSFYQARAKKRGLLSKIIPPTIMASAASNYLWISAANASGRAQEWPGVLVRPDGTVAGTLKRDNAGVLVSEVDTAAKFYDAAGPFRRRAMRGLLSSTFPVSDPRSADRHAL